MKKYIILLLIPLLLLTGCNKKESLEESPKTEKYTIFIDNGAIIKLNIEVEEDAVIKSSELINKQATEEYSDYKFNNKKLSNILEKIVTNDTKIYTDWGDSSYLDAYKEQVTIQKSNDLDYHMAHYKTIPLNQEFTIQIVVGMEYYNEIYEFISDKEVKWHTEGACYGECEENGTSTYSQEYDIYNDISTIDIDNTIYTYNYQTQELSLKQATLNGVLIEDYTGKNYKQVKADLESHGLKVTIEEVESNQAEQTIVSQSINAGFTVPKNSEIILWISPIKTVYPDFTKGYTIDQVMAFAEQYDLVVKVVNSSSSVSNKIVDQSRQPGTKIVRGTIITIYLQ